MGDDGGSGGEIPPAAPPPPPPPPPFEYVVQEHANAEVKPDGAEVLHVKGADGGGYFVILPPLNPRKPQPVRDDIALEQ